MSISPWTAGATAPQWAITFNVPGSTPPTPVNIAGATFTLTIRNLYLGPNDANYERAGTGQWAVTNGAAGQAVYAPSPADVATPGTYQLIFKVVDATGAQWEWTPVPWVVGRS